MKRVAVFLDAGYFWVQLCKVIVGSYNLRAEVVLDYEALRKRVLVEVGQQFGPESQLLRIYWYDGPGVGGKTSEHHAIDKLDDFKLRLGTRNSVGTQKGVDGLFIADLISLAQQRAITDALLVTGDADITPGIIVAQSMGLRVHLLSLGSSAATSPYLAAEADLKRCWSRDEIKCFAQAAKHIMAKESIRPVFKVELTTDVLEGFAKAAKEQILAKVGSCQSLMPLVAVTTTLPKEIDTLLLTIARKSLGRSLQKTEKQTLRAAFKRLVSIGS